MQEESLDDITPHEKEAEVDPEDIVKSILDEEDISPSSGGPDGSQSNPYPFQWHKPFDIYEPTLDFPNADRPSSLSRTDGPTDVYWYPPGRRSPSTVKLGVADWPSPSSPAFLHRPLVGGRGAEPMPNQSLFNRRLDSLGFDRTGLDAEHVWDVGLRGPDFDRLNNLWPADRDDQQIAGTRHGEQIQNLTRVYGPLAGKYLKIVRMRPPNAPVIQPGSSP